MPLLVYVLKHQAELWVWNWPWLTCVTTHLHWDCITFGQQCSWLLSKNPLVPWEPAFYGVSLRNVWKTKLELCMVTRRAGTFCYVKNPCFDRLQRNWKCYVMLESWLCLCGYHLMVELWFSKLLGLIQNKKSLFPGEFKNFKLGKIWTRNWRAHVFYLFR